MSLLYNFFLPLKNNKIMILLCNFSTPKNIQGKYIFIVLCVEKHNEIILSLCIFLFCKKKNTMEVWFRCVSQPITQWKHNFIV